MTLIELLLISMIWTGCTLTSYGLVHVFFVTDGPFDLFQQIRMRSGAHSYGADGKPDSFLGKLMGCPYCLGLYVVVIVSLLLLPIVTDLLAVGWNYQTVALALVWVFGGYGGQVALESMGG